MTRFGDNGVVSRCPVVAVPFTLSMRSGEECRMKKTIRSMPSQQERTR